MKLVKVRLGEDGNGSKINRQFQGSVVRDWEVVLSHRLRGNEAVSSLSESQSGERSREKEGKTGGLGTKETYKL